MIICKYLQNFAESCLDPPKPIDHLGIPGLQVKNPDCEEFSKAFQKSFMLELCISILTYFV